MCLHKVADDRIINLGPNTVVFYLDPSMQLNDECNWATTRQNVSSGVSDQARHKPACTATEAS